MVLAVLEQGVLRGVVPDIMYSRPLTSLLPSIRQVDTSQVTDQPLPLVHHNCLLMVCVRRVFHTTTHIGDNNFTPGEECFSFFVMRAHAHASSQPVSRAEVVPDHDEDPHSLGGLRLQQLS